MLKDEGVRPNAAPDSTAAIVNQWLSLLLVPNGIHLLRADIQAHDHCAAGLNIPCQLHQSASLLDYALADLLTANPYLVPVILPYISQCALHRISKAFLRPSLELLHQIHQSEYYQLLVACLFISRQDIQSQYISTLPKTSLHLPPALLSADSPLSLRIQLCRHILNPHGTTISSLSSVLSSIISSLSASTPESSLLITEIFTLYNTLETASLLYSIVAGDAHAFIDHLLDPVLESLNQPSSCAARQLLMLVLQDDNIYPVGLSPAHLKPRLGRRNVAVALSQVLLSVWSSPTFCLTSSAKQSLFDLSQLHVVDDDAMTTLLQAHPQDDYSDVFRFCLMSGLSDHISLFQFLISSSCFTESTVDSVIMAVHSIVSSSSTHLSETIQILSDWVASDSFSFDRFLNSHVLMQSLASHFLAYPLLQSLLQFKPFFLINNNVVDRTVVSAFMAISKAAPHSNLLIETIPSIIGRSEKLTDCRLNSLLEVAINTVPDNPSSLLSLAIAIVSLVTTAEQHGIQAFPMLYHMLTPFNPRWRPLVLHILLHLAQSGHHVPLELIRSWTMLPNPPSHDSLIVEILSRLTSPELVIEYINVLVSKYLTSSDAVLRNSTIRLISSQMNSIENLLVRSIQYVSLNLSKRCHQQVRDPEAELSRAHLRFSVQQLGISSRFPP
uniref:Uncharacterized protein n=1 Tax=Spongospora subterranea TaxID=70186 RepID=A0A0H5RRL0_9EUKA|eukprot:CRZ11349.1 hypothetical protein [Spongospora subterranea]